MSPEADLERSADRTLAALRAARAWLDLFVEHLDIDPETTFLTVTATTPESRRVLADCTLAQSLAEIDAVLREEGGP